MKGFEEDARAAEALVKQIMPLMAGKGPDVQSAALADLMAMWLAGHVVRGDPEATERLRKEILEPWLETVWQLVPLNYAANIEPQLKAKAAASGAAGPRR
jgi:hypothetical protein